MTGLHLIPDRNNLDKFLVFAEQESAVFEYNDFFQPDILDDSLMLHSIIDTYKSIKRDRSKDTIHGAFMDIAIHSQDKRIREVSQNRVKASMEIADILGIRGVIFHTNTLAGFKTTAYTSMWVEKNQEFFSKLCSEYKGIDIYIENMFDLDPELLSLLAVHMDSPNFGVCLDIAHAILGTVSLETWFQILAPYIKHLHINDNDGKSDLHQPVGSGIINWGEYHTLIQKYCLNPSVLIEAKSLESQKISINYLKKKKYYPFSI